MQIIIDVFRKSCHQFFPFLQKLDDKEACDT